MTLVPDWKRILRGSWTVWLAFASTVFYGIGGALFVYAEPLGPALFFALDVACFVIAGLCTALVPFARIVRQARLHDDADQ